MGRINIFEFEDLSWFPEILRNYGTDFLRFGANHFDMYKGVLPVLKKAIELNHSDHITDLASGSGGGWNKILENLRSENVNTKVILSDLFPNISSFEHAKRKDENIDFIRESTDALNMKFKEGKLYTMFLSFHHFKRSDAQKIISKTVDSRSVLAIFEGQDRSAMSIISMLLSPLSLWLSTPFIKPFSVGRLIFTYLIPVLPFTVMWDGVASSLRTYNVNDINNLISDINNKESYNWEIGKTKSGPVTNIYLLAYPK